MIGNKVNGRYRIDCELGSGGMGKVYKGYDTALKRDIAIKMMIQPGMEEECRNRIMGEAHAIARLSHPNIITIYDVGILNQFPFIVMEYVEGVNLYQQPPKDIKKIVMVCKQICIALAHAHGHGIIHRDLKPENVILTPEGTAKLMDFGLARPISSRVTKEGAITGSVFYLAPEQAQGKAINQSSDLYSLGIMLYELTTGELPFRAEDPLAVISQHIHAPVVPPKAKNGHIPAALDALILDLMKKEPTERPPSALAVAERLSTPDILDVTAQPRKELSALDRIVRGRLAGREQEMQQLRNLWLQTVNGNGQLVLISGEAGVGKTRLMRELVTQVEVTGGQAYIGESKAEGNAPYSPIAQIIQQALSQNEDTWHNLPKLVLPELISIAPELQINYSDLSPNPALDPESEQRRLFECIIAFFSTLCNEKPLLLVLEDIHWADSGTLSMLEFLAARCQQNPVLLLVTLRDTELEEDFHLRRTLTFLQRKKQAAHLRLEPLTIRETHDMLANIFAEHITPDFLDGIYSQSEGNPFFIEEMCKALIESGQLYFDGERWQRPPDMADMVIPESIKFTIQSRLSKLSQSAQETLLHAAILGHEFEFNLLVKITERQEEEVIEGLEAALKAQLIEELKEYKSGRFSFSHALIPSTLRESMSGIRQARMHREVAQALEESMPDAYRRLAYHWGESGNLKKQIDYIIKSAVRAKKTYANKDAIRLYSDALVMLPEKDERRFYLLKARAELFNFVADRKSQHTDIQMMLQIARQQEDQNQLLDAFLALAELYLQINPQAALEPAQHARRISQELKDLPRKAKSIMLIGRYYYHTLDHKQAIHFFKQAIQIARKAGLKPELVSYLRYLGKSEFNLGSREAAKAAAEEVAALSLELKDPRSAAIGTLELAFAHLAAMNYTEGLPESQSAVRMAREIGDLGMELDAQLLLAMMLTGLEKWEEAINVYQEVLNTFDLFSFEILPAVNNIEYCYKYLGEQEKIHNLIKKLMQEARQAANDHLMIRLTANFYAESCFRLGKYQEGLKHLEMAFPYVENLGNQIWLVEYLKKLGLFSALLGDIDSANRYITSAQTESEQLDDSYAKNNVWTISALVALINGDANTLPAGIEHAKKGIAMFDQIGYDVFWECYCILAGLYLANNQPADSLATLEKAFDGFEKDFGGALLPPEMFYSMASHVYRANHQPDKADDFLRKAYARIMLVAGNIQDHDLRQCYLENVKDNCKILQEASARGIASVQTGRQTVSPKEN